MASQALNEVEQQQKQILQRQYGGKMSNQFISQLKSSTLSQLNWGELLTAAPTAFSLMGSCWLAACDPAADGMDMSNAAPAGGFKYIYNRSRPNMKSLLVEVLQNGSREAFVLASRNMAGLQQRVHQVSTERIDLLLKRLPAVNRGPDQLEDFNDALQDLAHDARESAKLATEIREAFSKWGKMVGELYAATENQQSQTQAQEITASIDKTFATDASSVIKESVNKMSNLLQKAEKRLDTALYKVPEPWETVVQGAATGFIQAFPSLIAGSIPTIMAASDPLGAGIIGSKASQKAIQDMQAAGQTANQAVDPAYAAALEISDLLTHVYEYLGGEKGTIDSAKFDDAGCAYLLAILKNRKTEVENTGTEPNQQYVTQLDTIIAVITDIQGSQNALASKADEWKTKARAVQLAIVKLALSAPTQGGNTNIPNAFLKVNVQKSDPSGQKAQLSTAMQGVRMSQNAADLAQTSFDAAVKNQQETAKAAAEVTKRLTSLNQNGKTLQEIKQVLRDFLAVLIDLVVQTGKVERLFSLVSTVIDDLVTPTAKRLEKGMDRRDAQGKYLKVEDNIKQIIYVSMLQLKGYSSLLEDITAMYSQVDMRYISPGLELLGQFSRLTDRGDSIEPMKGKVIEYSATISKEVAELVARRQNEMLGSLRDRARDAAETTSASEETVRKNDAIVDSSAKQATEEGKKAAERGLETLIHGQKSATVMRIEETSA